MKGFKGTKGKWYAGISNDVKQEGTRKVIADCCFFGQDRSIEKANALLISKAPELLEAMQEFCDRVDKGQVRSTKTYNKFKELIKQATEV